MKSGYVLFVPGRRGGFAAPVDLLRAHLRALGRAESVALGRAVVESRRARLREAFADYLVTDESPFSERRWWHEHGSPYVTGRDWSRCSAWQKWVGERDICHLDAPDYVVAGAARLMTVLQDGTRLAGQLSVARGEA